MKKIARSALSLVSPLGILLALGVSDGLAQDPAAAKVNGEPIPVSEVVNEMRGLKLGKDAPQDKVFGMIRDRLVELKLLADAAKKEGLGKDPEVLKALEKFKQRLLIQSFVSKKVKSLVTEESIKEKIKTFPPQKEVKLGHILVGDKKTALSVIKALTNGSKKFEELAASVSIDEASKHKGGDLGGGSILEVQLPEVLAGPVRETKAGAFTTEPIQSPSGFHIVKVKERRDASPEMIAPLAREKLEQESLMALIKRIKESARVELFDQQGKPSKEVQPK